MTRQNKLILSQNFEILIRREIGDRLLFEKIKKAIEEDPEGSVTMDDVEKEERDRREGFVEHFRRVVEDDNSSVN